jgi:hypothetical protein
MNSTKTTRRVLLAGLPAIAATMVAPAAATKPESLDAMAAGLDPETRRRAYEVIMAWMEGLDDETGARDPVFAAIEAHKQACIAVQAAVPSAENEDPWPDLCEVEGDTLAHFLYTEPTTIAGCLSALDFASSPNCSGAHEVCPISVLTPAFRSGDEDLVQAGADWPAMIAHKMRILIEVRAWFGPIVTA